MHLVDCERPVRVFNKYINEFVWASCGKCAVCRKRRANRWISRLELERQKSLCSFFVTLTYDNYHLPLYNPDGFGNLFSKDGCILYDNLEFDSSVDRGYFEGMCLAGGIPYASRRDITLFHKRLNKYIHDKITSKWSNFRYFTVSEYGETGHRPHFHSIYFVNDERLRSRFVDCILSCWSDDSNSPIGRCDVQHIENSACSYVASYLNCLFDLPSFYKNRSLRPFMVCSKRPSIGDGCQFSEDDAQIFYNTSVTRIIHQAYKTSPDVVPLHKSTENRLFPKLSNYRSLPYSLRVELYGCSCRFNSKTFSEWFIHIRENLSTYLYSASPSSSILYDYLSCQVENFTRKGIERLRRIYYQSKRVLANCKRFGVSLLHYVNRIDEFISKKELYVLKQFYEFQSEYSQSHDVSELVNCYPEYAYQNVSANYIAPLDSCQDYQLFVSENRYSLENMTKSHFKNAYLEKKLNDGDLSYLMIYIYHFCKSIEKLCQKT